METKDATVKAKNSTPKTTVETITPKMAREWLESSNTRNRNLSPKKVSLYADDMKNNRWTFNHQGIAFYANGELADGQHRLAAIIKSGKPIKMMVTRGLPVEVGADIDRHRARNEADAIRIGGLSEWMGPAEVKVVKALAGSHGTHPNQFTAKQLASIGELVKNEVLFATSLFTSRSRYVTTAPVMAAVAIASNYYDKEVLERFVKVLVSGMPISEDDMTPMRLRELLIREHGGHGGTSGREEIIKKVLKAIELYSEGRNTTRIQTPKRMPNRLPQLDLVV